jgi:hypothetical protein
MKYYALNILLNILHWHLKKYKAMERGLLIHMQLWERCNNLACVGEYNLGRGVLEPCEN